jgi:hypothetical protein
MHKGDVEGTIDIVFSFHLQQDVPSFSICLQAHVKGQLYVGVVVAKK